MPTDTIQRKHLLTAEMDNRNLTAVDVREIRLEPRQETGRHLHPCPVVGFIKEGTATYQIEGEPAITLPAGAAFYEPADTVIASFANASDRDPLVFVAFYMLDGDQELIKNLQSR
jgi:quercetin dioxygenase-like cupin family protein